MSEKRARKTTKRRVRQDKRKAKATEPVSPVDARAFEMLVSRIEEQLAPRNAVVKSPDHIPDRDTGELREVDASIRYTVGSTPVLITIECRKRGRASDVQWIEQLASKHQSLGASVIVAVSSSGFSKNAVTKAEKRGVVLRTLSELQVTDFQHLVDREFQFDLARISVQRFDFDLEAPPEGGTRRFTLAPNLQDEWSRVNSEAKILFEHGTDAPVTLDDLIGPAHRAGRIPLPAEHGARELRSLTIVPESDLYTLTTHGRHRVKQVRLEIAVVNAGRQRVPVKRVHRYGTPTEPIRLVAEARMVVGSNDVYDIVAMQRPTAPATVASPTESQS